MKINENVIEGTFVTVIGLIILIASILLPDNPIKFEGWIGLVVQAGFLPTILSSLIIILGLKLMITKKIPTDDKAAIAEKTGNVAGIRIAVVIGLTAIYIILLGKINFAILSFCYFIALISYLKFAENDSKGNKTLLFSKIFIISITFTIVISYLLPYMLRLQVP